jgi:hypothetical protein
MLCRRCMLSDILQLDPPLCVWRTAGPGIPGEEIQQMEKLAVEGGRPVRTKPPITEQDAFEDEELQALRRPWLPQSQ